MIVINSSTRQFTIPGADLVFGVEADSGSEIKVFQSPRYVGNNVDLASSFIRMNYRNANGEVDSYLVKDITVEGDNIVFTWELTPKVTMYKGQVSFVMCVTGPDTKVKWHTTLGKGQVLEGLEPDLDVVEIETADVVAQLIAMVEAQTGAVKSVGESWVATVKSEGATQVAAVKSASEAAEAAAVAEIEAKGVNTRATIPEDYTALQSTVDELNRSRGPVIVCEAAGENVVIGDSSNLPMQGLRVFGKTTQVTTTGKNLLEVSEENAIYVNGYKNYTVNNGVIKITNVALFAFKMPVVYGTGYAFSFKKNATETTCHFRVYEYGAEPVAIAGDDPNHIGTPINSACAGETNVVKNYTPSAESVTWVAVGFYTTQVNTITEFMAELGNQVTTYEPYTGGKPSPSPDYPQELVSLEPVVNVYGKNLLTAPYKDGVSKEHGGLTYTVREDGSVHVVGTVTSAESYFVLSEFNFGESSVAMGKSNGVYVWSDCLYNRGRHYTLLYFSNGNEVDRVYYPQVELGTTATEYEVPATTQTVEITHTLPGIPVVSGGNYTDADGQQWICDEVDFERGVYIKRIGETVFDDQQVYHINDYRLSNSGHYVFGCSHSGLAVSDAPVMSDQHRHVRWDNWSLATATHDIVCYTGVAFFFFLVDQKIQTIEAFTEYMGEHPATVQYILTTPIETPLSETEIAAYRDLHSNYPNTTILNDSGAHMVVKYAADTKLYIDNKIKEALQ